MIIPFFFQNEGLTIKPFIFVYNKDDKCLIEHEKVHLRQQRYWFPFNLLWLFKWIFNKKFRHTVEKEAVIVQLQCIKSRGSVLLDKDSFADFMVRTYYFKKEEALELINLHT